MFYLIVITSLLVLGFLAYVFSAAHRHGWEDNIVVGPNDCSSCLGDNPRCEQTCAMEAAIRPIEYFDDEHLDAFQGRRSDDYEDSEIEQFAYVLHTMQPNEVIAWQRSLTLRGINLQDALKDEFFILVER